MAVILLTHGVPSQALDSLDGHSIIKPENGCGFSKEELLALLPEADCVLACGAMDAQMIEAGKQLGLIVCYGAGYDKIDIDAATKRGVLVCNTPDSVTTATAEVAIGLMLAVKRRICELDAAVRSEGSAAFGMGKRMGSSLEGGVLGIVGMGRIGGRVADFGRMMGMRIVYTARTEHEAENAKGASRVLLRELMERADVISIHCPLTDQTKGMITGELLDCMKAGAVLINTARGQIINEQALIEKLQKGELAGAGLDVYADEPDVPKALRQLPNVVLTPHIGSNTLEARQLMAKAAAEHITKYLMTGIPDDLLNPAVLTRK